MSHRNGRPDRGVGRTLPNVISTPPSGRPIPSHRNSPAKTCRQSARRIRTTATWRIR